MLPHVRQILWSWHTKRIYHLLHSDLARLQCHTASHVALMQEVVHGKHCAVWTLHVHATTGYVTALMLCSGAD